MSWICDNCETGNADSLRYCEVCNYENPKYTVMAETNDSKFQKSMTASVKELSSFITQIRNKFVVINKATKEIRSLSKDTKISERDKQEKIQKGLNTAKYASIFFEGLLAYRGCRYIFESMMGIQIGDANSQSDAGLSNEQIATFSYIALSIILAYFLVEGAIKLAINHFYLTKGESESNQKQITLWNSQQLFFALSLLYVLPILNLVIHFTTNDTQPIYILFSVISIVINVTVVKTVSKHAILLMDTSIGEENLHQRLRSFHKIKNNAEKESMALYTNFNYSLQEVDTIIRNNSRNFSDSEVQKYFTNEVIQILEIEGKIKASTTKYLGFFKWWKSFFVDEAEIEEESEETE
jgi:hypothetical protein